MAEPELALPNDYPELLEDLKRTASAARWHTQQVVDTSRPRTHTWGRAAQRGSRPCGQTVPVTSDYGTVTRPSERRSIGLPHDRHRLAARTPWRGNTAAT